MRAHVRIVDKEEMAQSLASYLADLADRVSLERLPDEVVHEGRRMLVDTLACILAGCSEPPVQELARVMSESSASSSSAILGTDVRAEPRWAALAMGTAAVWHDFDSGNRFLGGHPAPHVIPAALAVGEAAESAGRRLLEATIAGYEIAGRVGRATRLREGMHPHGSWPVVGAAAAAAMMAGQDRNATQEAIAMSSSLTLATSFQAAFEGATVRNLYAGHGAAVGVLASELASCGFSGERMSIENIFGTIVGVEFDAAAASAPDSQWEIMRAYYKPHACARYLHPALEALMLACPAGTVQVDDIREITVRTFDFAASMNEIHPANPLAAKFSLPHALAAYLVLGSTGIDAFSSAAIADSAIRKLAERVSVTADAAMSRQVPMARPAAVRVLVDGRPPLEAAVQLSKSDHDAQPLTDEQLSEKFVDAATRVVSHGAAARLLELLWKIESVPTVGDLGAALR